MRIGVWSYRFAPNLTLQKIIDSLNISRKTLMRYVHNSCNPNFAKFGLYFGEAGSNTKLNPPWNCMMDRAVSRKNGRIKSKYMPISSDPSIPTDIAVFFQEYDELKNSE